MKKFLVLLATASAMLSCSKIHLSDQAGKNDDAIVSTRPQNIDRYFGVLKLQNPPLLSQIKIENGKKILDADLAKEIEKEQVDIIGKLQKISPEIKILFRYRMVLNAIAVTGPASVADDIEGLAGVSAERSHIFTRPVLPDATGEKVALEELKDGINSVAFIGADIVHAKGITGKGMKIGVIDTGIDYTHSMLKGPGTEEAYKSVDPGKPTPLYPNDKVVGGIDLVGTDYDSASDILDHHVPKPDANPIDEAGHGSHVAGTIAGIGDGIHTYSGVAPDATLYAIKVFGAEGSTSDEAVIAGLEFAADPNHDMNLADELDVVNLSLGGPYGSTHALYSEAIKNLSAAGTIVVASAGNEGVSKDFITGSPAAVDGAFSVAASVDFMPHNFQFKASAIDLPGGSVLVEAIEGPATISIEQAVVTEGELAYIGAAIVDLTPEQKAAVNGKVALIDRGVVPFQQKIQRAFDAHAIGVVMVNNTDGQPIQMGKADEKADAIKIPAIMIAKDIGEKVKAAVAVGKVVVHFKTNQMIAKPELIDTLADFSSKGPRSFDAIMKPEIAAPGVNIISAAMGKGSAPAVMSGTSMSGPHIAGVMALMKQAHPDLNSSELQSMVMGTSKSITDKDKKVYLLSQQGAGRVQVDQAIVSKILTSPVDLSMGIVSLDKSKVLRKTLAIKNISDQAVTLALRFEGSSAISMRGSSVTIAPHSQQSVNLDFAFNSSSLKATVTELDGFVKMNDGKSDIFKVALLALAQKVSSIHAETLQVMAASALDAPGSLVQLNVKNASTQAGDLLLFNEIALDERKPAPHGSKLGRICDLEAAGYKISGDKIQIAIKLYEPLTSWELCQISVLLDGDGDGEPDQEIAGVTLQSLAGAIGEDFKSLLLDAGKARQVRAAYEKSLSLPADKRPALNYAPALIDIQAMKVYQNSTIAIIEVQKSALATKPSGELAVKILSSSQEDADVQGDDYLGGLSTVWKKMDVSEKAQAFTDLPATVNIAGGASQTIEFNKGLGLQNLLVLMPQNANSMDTLLQDQQLEMPKVSYSK